MQCYAQGSPTNVASLIAASRAIDARLGQREMGYSLRTLRSLVINSLYVSLPIPGDINVVALARPGLSIVDNTTAEDALSVMGVRLAVDEETLGVGPPEGERPTPLAYQRISKRNLRFTTPVDARSLVLIDGVLGYGSRRSLHGIGTWKPLTAGVYEAENTHTGDPVSPLPAGTTLVWGRESMVITGVTSVDGPPQIHTYAVARDNESDHGASTDLWQLNPPYDLAEATAIVGGRFGHIKANPMGGTYDPSGQDISPGVWRNVSGLLRDFERPATA